MSVAYKIGKKWLQCSFPLIYPETLSYFKYKLFRNNDIFQISCLDYKTCIINSHQLYQRISYKNFKVK